MRLFRRPDRKGWQIGFTDEHGRVHRVTGYADKRASRALGERLEALVACRAVGIQPDRELSTWLANRPGPLRARLAKLGLIDALPPAGNGCLADYLPRWGDALRDRQRTAAYIADGELQVRRLLDGLRIRTIADLRPADVSRWLAAQMDHKPRFGRRTANKHLKRLKAFCNWLVSEGLASSNPVAHLTGYAEQTDRRVIRRALTPAELRKLVQTTAAQPTRWGVSGPHRALLYRFAAETGLRAGAIRSLTAASFDLDAAPPRVVVQAADSKNRYQHAVALRPELARDLRDVDRFALPDRSNMAKMLRDDLAAAGIPAVDPRGRIVDFHALRMTLSTALMEHRVHPSVQQSILGHRSAAITLDRYTDVDLDHQATALATLPSLGAPSGAPHEVPEP